MLSKLTNLLNNRCYHGGSHHNFKPRYAEEPNPIFTKHVQSAKYTEGYYSPKEYRKMFLIERYVCDICTWCGEKIKND